MHRALRLFCLAIGLVPLAAQADELRMSLHAPAPLAPSPYHINAGRGVYGTATQRPGSSEETFARSALQSRLDEGRLKIRILRIDDSGIRIVTLDDRG